MDTFTVGSGDAQVFRDIFAERARQDAKWGLQNHHLILWHLILAEEFGEVGRALNEWHFRGAPLKDVRDELIQTAAVCVAAVACLDRNTERFTK